MHINAKKCNLYVNTFMRPPRWTLFVGKDFEILTSSSMGHFICSSSCYECADSTKM